MMQFITDHPTILVLSLIISLSVLYLLRANSSTSKLPLPPGPPRLPVIGNLHQAPTHDTWRVYQRWTKEHGPIYSLQFGGQLLIMLGTSKTASDLLDKRGAIYSSRPHVVFGFETLSRGLRYFMMPYDEHFRVHQRVTSSYLKPSMSQRYRSIQDLESRQLLLELLSTNDFADRFKRYTSSIVFSLAYGKRMVRGDEDEVQGINLITSRFVQAFAVGAWIVDAIPALNRLPKFLAPWKRTADEWHAHEVKLYTQNLQQALDGTTSWNWAKQTMATPESNQLSMLEHAFDLGTMYEAGVDTTSTVLDVFILAAALYHAQIRDAQKELDDLCGSSLPTFEQVSKCKQVDAVVKEVLRWRPVAADGAPHLAMQDDEYMGYRIPKGTTIIAHHWSINHDSAIYENPDKFDPNRWIRNPDLPHHFFGFGRRVCTGRHIAMNSLLIAISRIMWAFDIVPDIDAQGKQIEIDPWAMTQGFSPRPMPFKVRFKPRSEQKRLAIERSYEDAEKDVGKLLKEMAPTE